MTVAFPPAVVGWVEPTEKRGGRVLVDPDKPMDIPPSVAVCPYCHTTLMAQFDEWTQEDDGTWSAEHFNLDCDTEPDMESDEWEGWMQSHSDMPYVYLLPVHERVKRWLRRWYRCDLKDEQEK